VHERLQRKGIESPLIEPGSPWGFGYKKMFDGKLRDELLI
jgi:hypothetical protein